MTVLSEANRYSATSSGSLGPYTIGYVVIDEDDIAVYVGGVLKTIATHYTVANAGTSSNATVTFTSGNAPASGVQIVVVRAVELVQLFNPANGDSFDSEALEGTIDRIYHGLHELGDKNDGTIKFSVALSGDTGFDTDSAAAGTVTANKDARINKGLMFDADGNITVTEDNPNEQVTLAEAQVALATTQVGLAGDEVGLAAAQVDLAEDQVDLAEDQVALATSWATKVDGAVSGSDFSAKAHASVEGANAPSEGSAKEWASSVDATHSPTAGSAKEWALGGQGTSANTADGSEFAAKEYAQGETATGGTAKQWSLGGGAFVEATPVTGSSYSAKKYAANAALSASAASDSEDAAALSEDAAAISATAAAAASIVYAIALG